MKKIILLGILCSALGACTVGTLSMPTQTPIHDTPTADTSPTPTIVWFPPTPTSTPFPTPVITPTEDMRPKLGAILLEDDFSTPGGWTLTQSQSGSIAYGKDELTIAIGEINAYLFSLREEPSFTDFYLEITAEPNLCSGVDEYGVLFRVSASVDYYRFSLSCDGQVRLDRLSAGQASSPQPWLLSGAVPPGAPSSSRLGVAAVKDEMRFFVNGQYQFSVRDPLLTSGGVGVFARSVNKKAVTVNFSDLTINEVTP